MHRLALSETKRRDRLGFVHRKLSRMRDKVPPPSYALLGAHPKDSPATVEDDPVLDAAVTALEASFAKPRARANSKQALVIEMLRRPEGATVAQIMEATGWQAHTVRGTLAGALKKRLGLVVISNKTAGSERVYRVGR